MKQVILRYQPHYNQKGGWDTHWKELPMSAEAADRIKLSLDCQAIPAKIVPARMAATA